MQAIISVKTRLVRFFFLPGITFNIFQLLKVSNSYHAIITPKNIKYPNRLIDMNDTDSC